MIRIKRKIAAALALTAILTLFAVACCAKKLSSEKELSGARIGVIEQSQAQLFLENRFEDVKIKTYSSAKELFSALDRRKCDGIVTFATGEIAPEFSVSGASPRGFYLSQTNSELTEKIALQIEEMISAGVIDEAVKAHLEGRSDYVYEIVDKESPMGTLKLCFAKNAFPFAYKTEDGYTGADLQIAQLLCESLGYDLVIEEIKYDALVDAVTSGKASFVMGSFDLTQELLDVVEYYSEPLHVYTAQ